MIWDYVIDGITILCAIGAIIYTIRANSKSINSSFYAKIILNDIFLEIPRKLNEVTGRLSEKNENLLYELRTLNKNYINSIAVYELYDNDIYIKIKQLVEEIDRLIVINIKDLKEKNNDWNKGFNNTKKEYKKLYEYIRKAYSDTQ